MHYNILTKSIFYPNIKDSYVIILIIMAKIFSSKTLFINKSNHNFNTGRYFHQTTFPLAKFTTTNNKMPNKIMSQLIKYENTNKELLGIISKEMQKRKEIDDNVNIFLTGLGFFTVSIIGTSSLIILLFKLF